jgi:hypothetical protein
MAKKAAKEAPLKEEATGGGVIPTDPPECSNCKWSSTAYHREFTVRCLVPLPPTVSRTSKIEVLKTSICALHSYRQ